MSIWAAESWSEPVHLSIHLLDGPDGESLVQAVEAWAKDHPLHDRPLLDMGQGAERSLTPDDIAAALRDRQHPAHRLVTYLFEVGLSGYSGPREELVGQLIDGFRGKTPN